LGLDIHIRQSRHTHKTVTHKTVKVGHTHKTVTHTHKTVMDIQIRQSSNLHRRPGLHRPPMHPPPWTRRAAWFKTVKARFKTVKARFKTVKARFKTVQARFKTVKAVIRIFTNTRHQTLIVKARFQGLDVTRTPQP